MKRALVTGGAGFVGRHLCARLLALGYEVVCLDNLCSGSRNNIEEFATRPGFTFVLHDVCEPYFAQVDEIYNLACPASPVFYQIDPEHTVKTCVLGAMNAMALARRVDATVFQASTSEVYGDPQCHPQVEAYCGNVNPLGPRACYDEGKRCAETVCVDHHRRYGTRVKLARIFNTYGPFMRIDDGRVVSNFIVQALRNEPLTLYGDGMQTRSFCYIDDIVDAILTLSATPAGITGPINLGNPRECTIRHLALLIRTLANSTSSVVFKPLPADDPRQRRPDITLAETLLAWRPRQPLEQGIRATIAYFAGVLNRDGLAAPARSAAHGA